LIAGTCRSRRRSGSSAVSRPRSTPAPASDGCAWAPAPTPPTIATASAWSRRSWSSPCPGSRSSRRPRPRDESGSPTCPGRSASATRARSCSPPAPATASPSRPDEPTCSSTRSAAASLLLLRFHQVPHLVVQRPHPVLDLRRARELLGGEHLANVERRGHGVIHELLARAREPVQLGLQVADLQVASREELVEERRLPRAHLAHERARLRAPIGHDLLHLRLLLVGELRAPQQERQHHRRAVAPGPHHH